MFDTVKRIWALGKCAIEIHYLLLLTRKFLEVSRKFHDVVVQNNGKEK